MKSQAVWDVMVSCGVHDCEHFEQFACLHLGQLDPEAEGKRVP